MQPYVFPYIGYFQLVKAVDLFIFYNDVNFIKRGWVHRNRILLNASDFLFTIPCSEVSQNKLICETRIAWDGIGIKKFIGNITHAYKRAPYFEQIFPLIQEVVSAEVEFIDEFAIGSIKVFATYLSLPTRFVVSKGRYNNENLKGGDRLIDICRKERANDYVNAIGGLELYSKNFFHNEGINLQFLKSKATQYNQFGADFIPWLSMIDVLMFNSKEKVLEFLDNYELV